MMRGKGASYNPDNPFLSCHVSNKDLDGIDEYIINEKPPVQLFYEHPKSILSKNSSPDLKYDYSVNPYQGCEHGCIYCYARNSHTYWGFGAGLDFESKIIVKKKVVRQVEEAFQSAQWNPQPIMLSGNTDCYQPIESQLKLTRGILKVCLKYRNPVSIITKNALILRDNDILSQLASLGLVHVYFSITTLNEKLRGKLEPRTATSKKKLEAIQQLTRSGVPVGVMMAPIIPGINHHEIPALVRQCAEQGALDISYTVLRLNGQTGELFEDWLERYYPERKSKVLHQVSELHGGKVNDTEWGRRIKGSGQHALMIKNLFAISKRQHFGNKKMPAFQLDQFRKGGHYQLF